MTTANLTPEELRAEMLASLERRGIAPPPPREPKPEPKPAGPPEYLTTNDLAPLANCAAHTLRTHLDAGEFEGAEKVPMPAARGGYYWRIPYASAMKWLEAREAMRGYSIAELAEAAQVSKDVVKYRIDRGDLPCNRVRLGGTKWRKEVPKKEGDAFIAAERAERERKAA
ncbi:MAG TPA: hypothetical protein VFX29_00860 [Longimicrobiaceae bacterium]|nr:hypothetical protein [Longimicrobiaceae bacterium]